MDLDLAYPAIDDLRRRARRRVPHFVWEFLDSATGDESSHFRNMTALDAVRLMPGVLRNVPDPSLSAALMGRVYPLPFGIAPVGMSGLIWPKAEVTLAALAAREGVPYCLSSSAAATPEDLAHHIGDQGWFQLYPPGDPEIRRDMLARARDAGFHTLILTADVPVASRRERQRRARLNYPMKLSPAILAQVAMRPAWAVGMAQTGVPGLKTLEKYVPSGGETDSTSHIGYRMRTIPDWDYLAALREEWDGHLVVKGVLDPAAARMLAEAAIDAVWVSNHGGRQFAAAPSGIECLAAIREATGPDMPILYDGGIRSGTDILRALALGADFVMLGRAFHYGLAALGAEGAAHVVHILREGLIADMGQLGITQLSEVRGRVFANA